MYRSGCVDFIKNHRKEVRPSPRTAANRLVTPENLPPAQLERGVARRLSPKSEYYQVRPRRHAVPIRRGPDTPHPRLTHRRT